MVTTGSCSLKLKRLVHATLPLLFLLGLTGPLALAQNTASISGTVKDQSNAVLPGVEVTATQTATGAVRTALTDETGTYTLTNLPIGPYKMEAALPGFRTYGHQNYIGPWELNINAALTRKFRVRESQTIEFRAEAFNLPNHLNANNPAQGTPTTNAINSPNFGKILTAKDPRIVQLALKYIF